MKLDFLRPRAATWQWLWLAGLVAVAGPTLAQRNPLKAVSAATRQMVQKGDYPAALVEIDQRLRQDSLNTGLLVLHAECHLYQFTDAHAATALADLNKLLRLRPNTGEYLAGRSYAYFRLRRYPESVADLSAALHQTPAAPVLLCQRGLSYLALNRTPEALTDFSQANSLDPDNRDYALMLAIGQMVSGSYPAALKTCNARAGKHKSDALVYANRALVRQRLNDPAGARQDANEALRLAPTDSTASLTSAFVLEQGGETSAAQRLYDELQTKGMSKASFYFERGDLHLQMGQIPQAEADWREAARLGNLDAPTRLAAAFKAGR